MANRTADGSLFVDRGRGRSIADYIDAEGDCWVWVGARNPGTGYGVIRHRGRVQYAHRVVWRLLVGHLPDDRHIDHLCRNRPCVNPDHLEPVTVSENNRRAPRKGPPAVNAQKTHCIRGHPFDEANTLLRSDGGRRCRKCKALQQRKARRHGGRIHS